jgi:hypothetical protein
MRVCALSPAIAALALAGGCLPFSNTHPTLRGGIFAEPRPRAPLAADEQVVLAPAEDASILGRVFVAPYAATRPLAEQLAPNPCADALVDVEPPPIEDDLFEDAPRATTPGAPRVYYRLHLRRRVEKAATKAYAECCKKAACGAGYVRAAAFGDGEVALARFTPPGGNADVAFEDEGSPVELALSERRAVRGFIAIAIGGQSPHAARRGEEPEGPGIGAYEAERIEVRELPHQKDQYRLCTKAECISENEFVRRYARRTGSHELDDFLRDRAWRERLAGGVLTGVSGASMALGAWQVATADKNAAQKDKDSARTVGGILMGAGAGLLATGLAFLLEHPDVSNTDHFLTKSEARRFAERYNRALRQSLYSAAERPSK